VNRKLWRRDEREQKNIHKEESKKKKKSGLSSPGQKAGRVKDGKALK